VLPGAWQKISPGCQPCVPGETRQRVSSTCFGSDANGVSGFPAGGADQTEFAVFST